MQCRIVDHHADPALPVRLGFLDQKRRMQVEPARHCLDLVAVGHLPRVARAVDERDRPPVATRLQVSQNADDRRGADAPGDQADRIPAPPAQREVSVRRIHAHLRAHGHRTQRGGEIASFPDEEPQAGQFLGR